MLKEFREGFAKRAGERTAELILAAIVTGGTLTAWFAAPAVDVHLRLTHLQIVGCVFVLLLLIVGSAWASRALTLKRRPKFHLVQRGQRNLWGTSEQKDGSLATSIVAELVAKNLTNERVYLVTPRLIRPRLEGEVLTGQVHIDGGDPAVVPPRRAVHISVFLSIRGAIEYPSGAEKVAAILGIADDESHEQRVQVRLRRHSPPPPKRSDPGGVHDLSNP